MKVSTRIVMQATTDAMGNLFLTPKVRRYADAFRNTVVANGGPNDISVFAQADTQQRADLLARLPRRKVAEVEAGWPVSFLACPWEVGHWYGWDAHETDLPWNR